MEYFDETKAEKDFGFPMNIKQMGNIDRETKIYVEDYVYTYLYRYAKTRGKSEKLAFLAGRHYSINGQDTVVISGAVEGRYSAVENGNEAFTKESWVYADECMKKYFPSLSVVGWVRVQPEFGTFMMAKDEKYHKDNFKSKWQVFFVIDPAEMQDSMYVLSGGKESMRKAKGYFIYYDKNEAMQNYMIENNTSKPKNEVQEEEISENMSSGKTALNRLMGMKEKGAKKEKYVPDRVDAAPEIRKVLKQKEQHRKEKQEKVNVLTAFCAVVCVICVAMSAITIRERDKIKVLESEIIDIRTSYNAMSQQFEETVQVFSQQSSEVLNESAEETKADFQKYTIEEGDSLWYICREFYGGENRIEDIKALNSIENEDILYVGQTIILP